MIRQLHYTSCRRGRDGIEGFQVAAAGPGIAARHEDLALPLAAYRPPPSAPSVPSAAEIAALPVAFGYCDLGDAAVLFRSHYVGEDFTGRQGNYFAHVLIADAPAADLGGRPPAAAWEAPFWARAQGPAGTTLPPGPDLPLDDPGPHEAARRWLTGRAGEFGQLLGAVRDGLAGRVRQIVVVAPGADPAADVAAAVLAVTAPLPAALARRVSFTTFSAAPADVDLMVVGTTPDAALGPGRDRVVLRWGDPAPEALSGFAEVALDAWRAGPRAVAALRARGTEIGGLDADDLDDLAAAVRVVAPTGPGAAADPLPGLEFLMGRHPGRLDADTWGRVEESVAAGTVDLVDLARWSVVLRGTRGHRPLLEAAYLRALLGHLAVDDTDAATLWFPAVGGERADGVAAWAVAAVETDPAPDTAVRVLGALHRLGVEPPDADLRAIADLVLLPLVLDPAGDVGPVRALAAAPRIAAVMAALLEERLDDELVATAARSISVDAARWLARSATGGGRVALVTALRLAAAGEGDAVEVVLRHATDAAALDRLAELVWSGPPPAADGLRLLLRLPAPIDPSPHLLGRLAERLIVDPGDGHRERALADLARQLDARRVSLPAPAGAAIDAVLLTEWFRAHPGTAADGGDRIGAAAAAAACAPPAVAEPLARALVNWLFDGGRVQAHAQALDAVHRAGATGVLPVYEQRLRRTLDAAEPAGILAVLPALVHVAPAWPQLAALLDGPCAAVLGRRRRRVLDDLGVRLSERGSVPDGLRPGRAANWTAWWKHYRETRLVPEAGLRGRISRLGRGG